MSKSIIYFIFLTLTFSQKAYSLDPILEWINSQGQSSEQLPTLKPSYSPFEEIQLRLDHDNSRLKHDQSVRISLNPIDGMSNELKLSKQRYVISELEKNELKKNKKLYHYSQILNYWRLKKSTEAIESSEFLFEKGHTYLKKIKSNQSIDFDVTNFIVSIANFNQLKNNFENQFEYSKQTFQSIQFEENNLLEFIDNMIFLDTEIIEKTINKMNSSTNSNNYEENLLKLKSLELTKKEKEHFQIFKFISYQRKETNALQNENTYQLAFRVPILSDNHEYEKAKLDFIISKNKIEQEKIKKRNDHSQLVSDLKSLIKKDSIYSLLPSKSSNRQKHANSLGNIDSIIKSEITFLKVKLESIQTKYEIFEKYLSLLSQEENLKSDKINYITQSP